VAEIVYPPVIVALKTFWKYLGLQFHFEGEAHIPRKGGAILAMNHIGYLDFALIGTAALPAGRLVRFMAKKEIFDNKLAGPLMRGMHHINVDRSSGTASFVAALRALRSGEVVGIFPEGTISRSFEIKELKSGAVRLAMGSGVPDSNNCVGFTAHLDKGRKTRSPSQKSTNICHLRRTHVL
jgi:1-acyl-sn-glycerol-3-phosphate acyltransferase